MPSCPNPPDKIPKSFSAAKTEKNVAVDSRVTVLSSFSSATALPVCCRLRTRCSCGRRHERTTKVSEPSGNAVPPHYHLSVLYCVYLVRSTITSLHLALGGCLCLRVSTNTWPPSKTTLLYKKERMAQRQGSHVFVMNHTSKTAWRTFTCISSTREPGCLRWKQ